MARRRRAGSAGRLSRIRIVVRDMVFLLFVVIWLVGVAVCFLLVVVTYPDLALVDRLGNGGGQGDILQLLIVIVADVDVFTEDADGMRRIADHVYDRVRSEVFVGAMSSYGNHSACDILDFVIFSVECHDIIYLFLFVLQERKCRLQDNKTSFLHCPVHGRES